jgi:hypothetical protein
MPEETVLQFLLLALAFAVSFDSVCPQNVTIADHFSAGML